MDGIHVPSDPLFVSIDTNARDLTVCHPFEDHVPLPLPLFYYPSNLQPLEE